MARIACVLCAGAIFPSVIAAESKMPNKPNFLIVFVDDLGYQDVGCFGSPLIKTPRLDQMAKEGMRFTDFYAQTICGPSRSSIMTGCYPLRIAKKRNTVEHHPRVDSREITMAEMLKEVGYATACFGKWDLAGHSQEGFERDVMPTKQGFDYFFGTPTSNDGYVNLLRNEKMIEKKANMALLTRRYTDEAIGFIKRNSDSSTGSGQAKPFFVYLAHTMPHTKLAASKQFLGKSKRGLYGDVVEEIDWNTGRLLDAVKELGLDDNTYVIFTSDNGPWWTKKEHGGSAKPLRGAKTSTWEGGLRVPCIMRAPGKIPSNTVCRELSSSMDLFPTFAALSGGTVPTDRTIDGHDIRALMHGEPGAKSPTQAYFFYQHTYLQAVRSEKWKLVLQRPAQAPWAANWRNHIDPKDVIAIEQPMLIDLEADISETTDVAHANPEVVKALLKAAEWARCDIGDYNRVGKNSRFFDPQPRRPDTARWREE